MTLTFDLDLIFIFFFTKDLKSKDPRSLSLMVYKIEMHITYIKCIRGNNSHMERSYRFGQNRTKYEKDMIGAKTPIHCLRTLSTKII